MSQQQALNKKQLFVRNLSYDTTTEELEQLFQEIGPLKNISIATGTEGKSKGYGFVKFALENDADAALSKLQGFELHGRKINLEFGFKNDKDTKKKSLEEQTVSAVPKDNGSRTPISPSVEIETGKEEELKEQNVEHVRRTRQIIVFGVPVDVNRKAFKNVLQKISRKAVEIELIKEDHSLSGSLHIITPPGKVMLVTTISRQEAAKLLKALNEGTINNLGFAKYVGKEESDDENDDDEHDEGFSSLLVKNRLKERLVARTLADVSELELRKRKCRLIVRNLSFQATSQNVVDKLKRFGPIVEIDVPTTVVKKTGTDEEITKEKIKGFAFVTFLCEKDAKSAVDFTSLKICNRDVAIDFCMSKESYLKYGKESDENPERNGDDDEDNVPIKDDGAGEADDSNMEDESGEEEDIDTVDEDVTNSNELISAKEEKQPLTGDVREGKTVFLRGLPFDAAPVDIKRVLGKFGKIEMALIVMDKATGVSKGCAFVKFAEKSSADLCLTGAAEGIVIKDKLCKVNLAVDKDAVDKIKTEAKVGKDKRNLYLANEGLVTDASQEISEHDREKRLRAQSDKKKKLQNPLFFVSNNRLSIRNLSKSVSDQDLRVACLKATKLGLERELVTSQDMKNLQSAQGSRWNTVFTTNLSEQDPLQCPKFDGRRCVKSAKIMFDLDKVRNSVPQSRGYAFVEFYHHAFALACLRQLNNNSQYENLASSVGESGSGKSRLLVEFSLENIRKVKILQEREERLQQRNNSGGRFETQEASSKKRGFVEDEKDKTDESSAKKPKVLVSGKISNVKLQNKKTSKIFKVRCNKTK